MNAETTERAVKERGILFTGDMVRSILDGRKTQTRRVVMVSHGPIRGIPVNPETYDARPENMGDGLWQFKTTTASIRGQGVATVLVQCPYGKPGDRLYVRETFRLEKWYNDRRPVGVPDSRVWYEADQGAVACRGLFIQGRKRPSIHMPKWASRIMLELLEVRVERVQEITTEEIWAEGLNMIPQTIPSTWKIHAQRVQSYADLWDRINARRGYGWDVNPWVWILTFKRLDL